MVRSIFAELIQGRCRFATALLALLALAATVAASDSLQAANSIPTANASGDEMPTDPGYGRLLRAIVRYRDLAAAGGWPDLPPGPKLGLGDGGVRGIALRRRLIVTGDLAAAEDGGFDRVL